MASKNLDDVSEKLILGQQTAFLAQKSVYFYATPGHITPLFWAQTDPTWWDHISPISWGNSGYLRFSGRWPFGRSAGRFTARLPKVAFFWVKNAVFRPETNPKKLFPLWRDTKKTTVLCWLIAWRASGGAAGSIFGPKFTPKTVFFMLHHEHPFLGLRRTTLYGIITSPYPEATLISFSFLIWDHFGPNIADNCFAD